MASRRFVVTVGEAPARVVVEDVRSRRRAVADDLAAVGGQIARLLDAPHDGDDSRPASDRPGRGAGR